MNKQRKVVITTTYNEMGIIIDTKVEEVAQPNLQPTCNQFATDTISRQAAMDALNHELRCGAVINQCGLEVAYEVIEGLPTAEPEKRTEERTETHACDSISRQAAITALTFAKETGTMKCGELKGVIEVLNRLPSAGQRRGRWMSLPHKRARKCSWCEHDEPYKFADDDAPIFNYCPYCGAKMDEVTT